MIAPASILLRAPMLTCGPMLAPGSTCAVTSTAAVGWMPDACTGRGSNSAAMRANAT